MSDSITCQTERRFPQVLCQTFQANGEGARGSGDNDRVEISSAQNPITPYSRDRTTQLFGGI